MKILDPQGIMADAEFGFQGLQVGGVDGPMLRETVIDHLGWIAGGEAWQKEVNGNGSPDGQQIDADPADQAAHQRAPFADKRPLSAVTWRIERRPSGRIAQGHSNMGCDREPANSPPFTYEQAIPPSLQASSSALLLRANCVPGGAWMAN